MLKNDATEILPEFLENTEMPEEQLSVPNDNETMNNRAQQGERHPQVSLSRTGKTLCTVRSGCVAASLPQVSTTSAGEKLLQHARFDTGAVSNRSAVFIYRFSTQFTKRIIVKK